LVVVTCVFDKKIISREVAKIAKEIKGWVQFRNFYNLLRAWPSYTRLSATTVVVERASNLPWAHTLRGYNALHLAAALSWKDAMELPVTLATFDRELWLAAREQGLDSWPVGLI